MSSPQEQSWKVAHVDPKDPKRTYVPASLEDAVNLKARGWVAVKAVEAPKNKAVPAPGPSK